ncbi:CV039-like protein [Mya arenaria]|uniref:CV039-like protein n=1 Tax=Mya arenaria TaxID=6604 RepID=A0ABY7E0Z4_MYAAR|nr:uncharacterized protein LOC128232666 [Mya arenaria]WAR03667.1 CV039-like protein [Mya arenaria]
MAAPNDSQMSNDKSSNTFYLDKNPPDMEFFKMYMNKFENCDYFKTEFETCKHWKSKINQKYLYGETLDCSHDEQMYDMCMDYQRTSDKNLEHQLAFQEYSRSLFRRQNARENDVWEYRTEPPEDWNLPIEYKTPEEEKKLKKQELKQNKERMKREKSDSVDDVEYLKAVVSGSGKQNESNKQSGSGDNSKEELITKAMTEQGKNSGCVIS